MTATGRRGVEMIVTAIGLLPGKGNPLVHEEIIISLVVVVEEVRIEGDFPVVQTVVVGKRDKKK